MPAVLRPELLTGVGITVTGGATHEIEARAERARRAPPATTSSSTSAHPPQDADGVRAALDDAWDAIRAHALPPARSAHRPDRAPARRPAPRGGPGGHREPRPDAVDRVGAPRDPPRGDPARRAARRPPSSPSWSRSSPRAPAPTTPAARSPFASPRHLDGVLRRRVARDDVLRRVGLRAGCARCASGAAARRACRPARPSPGPRGGRPTGSRCCPRACRARSRSSRGSAAATARPGGTRKRPMKMFVAPVVAWEISDPPTTPRGVSRSSADGLTSLMSSCP